MVLGQARSSGPPPAHIGPWNMHRRRAAPSWRSRAQADTSPRIRGNGAGRGRPRPRPPVLRLTRAAVRHYVEPPSPHPFGKVVPCRGTGGFHQISVFAIRLQMYCNRTMSVPPGAPLTHRCQPSSAWTVRPPGFIRRLVMECLEGSLAVVYVGRLVQLAPAVCDKVLRTVVPTHLGLQRPAGPPTLRWSGGGAVPSSGVCRDPAARSQRRWHRVPFGMVTHRTRSRSA